MYPSSRPLLFILFLSLCLAYVPSGAQTKLPTGPDTLLSDLSKRLASINTSETEKIPVYFNLAEDLGKVLTHYRIIPLPDSLVQEIKDTLAFKNRLTSVLHTFDSLSLLLQKLMSTYELTLYNKAMEQLAEGDTLRAVSLFESSLRYQPSFGPPSFQLVDLHLHRRMPLVAADYLDQAIKKSDSVNAPYYFNLFRALSLQVFDSLISSAYGMVREEKPYDAMKNCDRASRFMEGKSIHLGKERCSELRTAAKTVIYQSHMQIAAKAHAAGKYRLANEFYQKAGNYQKENVSDLPLATDWETGLRKLDNRSSQAQIQKAKPAKTRPYATRKKRAGRQKLSSRHSKSITLKKGKKRPEKLMVEKQDSLYLSLLRQSDKLIENRDFPGALKLLDSTASYASSLNIDTRQQLPPLFRKAAAPGMLNATYQAYYRVWKNELDTAYQVLRINRENQHKYALDEDSTLNEALLELEKRIAEKECSNLQSQYELSLKQATYHLNRHEFAEARDCLHRAETTLAHRKACPSNDTLYQQIMREWGPAFQWAEKVQEYTFSLKNDEIQRFLTLFNEAVDIFNQNQLRRQHLAQPDLGHYLILCNDNKLFQKVTLAFIENNDFEKAVSVVELLKTKGMSSLESKSIQEKAGNALGEKIGKQGEPPPFLKQKLKEPWFIYMRKAYYSKTRNCIFRHLW